MAVNAFTSNQGTQTAILTDNTGGTAGTVIPVMKISLDGQGTYTDANLFQGTLLKINTLGTLPNIPGGTIGSVVGIGSVSGLSNLPGGTLDLVTTVSNVTNGSVRITVGTITVLPNIPGGTLGSVVGIGSVSGLSNLPQGSINVTAGTIGGKAASGAAASGNPVFSGGTDSGGTIYGFLTDTKGQQYLGGGTVSMLSAGTISTLPNIPGGTLGSVVGLGGTVKVNIDQVAGTTTATAFDVNGGWAVRPNADTVALGDARTNSPSNLQSSSGNGMALAVYPYGYNGSTWDRLRTDTTNGLDVDVTRLPNLPGGSIVQTVGTVNTGTVNTGTINTGTINAGTFRDDGRPARNILTYGTQVTGTAAIAATIIGSASVGAGTSLWLQDVSITNNNANVLCVLGFGTAQQGTNVLLRHTLGTSGAIGMEKSLAKPVNAGMTNQDLVLSLGAAGTVDLTFSYFISA